MYIHTLEVQLSHLIQWSLPFATNLLQGTHNLYPSATGSSIPGAGKLVYIRTGDGLEPLEWLEKCL